LQHPLAGGTAIGDHPGMNAPLTAPLWSPSPVRRKNVARVVDAWYVACPSSRLGADVPLAAQVLGVPLAVWRTASGAPAAVLDRCPHRNVPLSVGRVKQQSKLGGELECRYHGWRFDDCGRLTAVPGLPVIQGERLDGPGRCTDAYRAVEQDGFVWVWLSSKDPATTSTPLPGYTHLRQTLRVEGTLHSTLENILDVPHTAFLHGGLFRTDEKKHEIEAIVTRARDSVVAEFVGEPRPEGLVGRILSPSGGVVQHWDRFLMPSIAQVEYRIGDENHVVVTSVCTPVSEVVTDMHAVATVKTRLPIGPLVALAGPVAWRILGQDKEILAAQTRLVERFGGDRFSSTSIDLLGPFILHLLKKAEAGALDDAIVREERFKLRV
jgi:phenylpropionate dioxygenase-like ring-hydroxylating dioxygenase large terminal subunit